MRLLYALKIPVRVRVVLCRGRANVQSPTTANNNLKNRGACSPLLNFRMRKALSIVMYSSAAAHSIEQIQCNMRLHHHETAMVLTACTYILYSPISNNVPSIYMNQLLLFSSPDIPRRISDDFH